MLIHDINTYALSAFLKLYKEVKVLICPCRSSHVAGPLYENEFLKISRGALKTINSLLEVDAAAFCCILSSHNNAVIEIQW